MSIPLEYKVAAGAVALVAAFAIANLESSSDVQRKSDLAGTMANQSIAACVMQQSELDQAPYTSRLKDVFMNTRSKTLDYFIANKITVCLDKRLQQQNNGFWNYRAQGIYYPDQKILTLWDNGKNQAHKGFFDSTAVSKGSDFLRSFSQNFGGMFDRYKDVSDVKNPLLGHFYTTTHSCGERCHTTDDHYDWEDAGVGWRTDTLNINPSLQQPPMQQAMY